MGEQRGWGRNVGKAKLALVLDTMGGVSGETCRSRWTDRSQSLHSTDAVEAATPKQWKEREAKPF